jgi:hypothetical protein
MVVTMLMVTAFCYGLRTHTCLRQKGSFLATKQYGGRERSFSPPSDQKIRFAGFAVRTRRCGQRAESPVSAGLCGIAATRNARTWVRTGFAGLHLVHTKTARVKN